ncbi:hypothetical protein BH11PSE1_BH11PSE1_18890 [soil metagenome]
MRRIAITASMLSLLATGALAQSGPPTKPWDLRKAQAFSNICLSQETGDARGMRLFVRPEGATPRVVVQTAEGAPLPPLAASAAKVDAKGLTFTVAATGEMFVGSFVGDVLMLKTKRLGKAPLRLHRRSDAAGFPVCVGDDGRA